MEVINLHQAIRPPSHEPQRVTAFDRIAHARVVYQLQREPADEHLEVKSTAWIGLFPAPNSEVFFRRGGGGLNDDQARDAIVVQSELRDEWYVNPTTTTIGY